MGNPLQGMTFKRTVIVGLGSTGLDILHAFQDFWYERFNNTDTSLVKLINIETAQANKVKSKPTGTMINQIFIRNRGLEYGDLANTLRGMENPLKNVEHLPWEWLWTKKINWRENIGTLSDDGAGGIRAGGRMLLYSPNPQNITNAQSFYYAVQNVLTNVWKPIESVNDAVAKDIFQKLRFKMSEWVDSGETTHDPIDHIEKSAHNPHFESRGVNAIVVGSLTGGTSSGMFIDLGYILQKVIGIPSTDLKRISGIFTIPPLEEKVSAISGTIAWDQVRANAFGSIYGLMRMMSQYSDDGKVEKMPYGYVYIVSPEYNTDSAADYFKSFDGLTEMVALRLFANVLGYKYKADEYITDEWIQNPKNYMLTMGTGAILYPKFTMIEMGSCELTRDFISSLINETTVHDSNGQPFRLNKKQIKNEVGRRIDDLTEKYISQTLRMNTQSDLPSIDETLMSYRKTLEEDMEQNKRLLYREFVEADGYFRNIIEENKEKMINGLGSDIEQELIQSLQRHQNIAYLNHKLDYYIKEFKSCRELWKLQGCDQFDAKGEIIRLIKEYKKYHALNAPTDLKTILQDLLYTLFDRYLISNAYVFLAEVIALLESWQTNIQKIRMDLETARSEFNERFDSFSLRLENDLQMSPIVKLFHKGKEADYRQIKSQLIGQRKVAGWRHLDYGDKPVKPALFWAQMKKGKVDMESVKNVLGLRLNEELNRYLEENNFNILDRAHASENRNVVSTVFSKIRTGFLKTKEGMQMAVGRIPTFIIAKGDKERLDEFIRNYQLDCEAFRNPIMEHMIIYTKDFANVTIEKLESYDKMKDAFLMDHPSQPDWTKLRLAYSDEVDFTIIEKKRYEGIHRLLEFMRYFWFKMVIQPQGIEYRLGETQELSYPQASLDARGQPVTDGVYSKAPGRVPHLYFIDPNSKKPVDLNLLKPESDILSYLCQRPVIYDALKNLTKPHLQFEKTDYLDLLYDHYVKEIKPSIDSKDIDTIFYRMFSDKYKKDTGMKAEDIQSKDCLIAHVYKLMKERG